jgi:hypothetical protein
MLDKAYAEGVTQGADADGALSAGRGRAVGQVRPDGGGKDEAMAVFSRCMSVAAPES